MQLTVFFTIFGALLAAAADVQTASIGPNGPPDGVPACKIFKDEKCCIYSLACQCYDGKFYYANTDNTCSPTVGGYYADNEAQLPGWCC
ncbi:hypothetical protein PG993_007808 [Apiospora rasikravindrae]|uniref:Uncharacterized protein n=1 Tax=Apiospora rasikravindrae TaxID=990691 RepID=A0ABR1SYX2_9PEZI